MKVNFFAPVNRLGYGVHSYNLMKQFEIAGHKVALIPPFGSTEFHDEHVERWRTNVINFSPKDPSIMIFPTQFLPNFSGNPRIGFPVFELEKFTPTEHACLASCDYLLTPSEWGKEVLAREGLRNVYVVPEGFDPEVFPAPSPKTDMKDSTFTFVHVGKFEKRKGTLLVIEAFFRALEKQEARLVMHIENPFLSDYTPLDELLQRLGFISTNAGRTYRRMGLVIFFSKGGCDQMTVFNLFRQAHCGVFPSAAEGWGLPILECIASGVPAIVGNWTGQSEYLNPFYPEEYLLKHPTRILAQDDMWFKGDRGEWNEVTVEELSERMTWAYAHARECQKDEEWMAAHKRIRREFTWENAALRLQKVLFEIIGL